MYILEFTVLFCGFVSLTYYYKEKKGVRDIVNVVGLGSALSCALYYLYRVTTGA